MKKQLQFTGIFTIDFDAERNRIKKGFNKKGYIKAAKRQMHLIDLFEKGDFEGWVKFYNKLPYFKKNEHSEKEFVGIIFTNVISLIFIGDNKFQVSNFKYV